MAYGGCYGNDIAWSQTAAVIDTWYPITDADIDAGPLSSVTNTDGLLTVGVSDDYLITYSVVVASSQAPRRVEATIYVNSDETANGDGRVQSLILPASGCGFEISSSAVVALLQNDTVRVAIRVIDGGDPTLECSHLNLSVVTLA